ncbi:MAG TPA: Asp-tRNA(Asn)/Glu-tRNA(Gln) amidotransferase subunit GatC [Clostridia bacterium]
MVTLEEILKISKLSRLTLDEQEAKEFQEEFNAIIKTIERLNELDTQGVEPTYSVLVDVNDLREDVARPSMDRDKILENAPEAEDGSFKVPTIVE